MAKYNVFDCTMVELDKHHSDRKGNLTVIENGDSSTGSGQGTLPFDVKRVYYLYDVPGGESRGGHAYRETEEFVIALSGSFDVIVDEGKEKKTFHLNRSYYGLYIPKGMWREMDNFSTNSLALEFASTKYNPEDYIRDYNEFLKLKEDGKI